MEETKKVQVLPREENDVTRIWQDFGWSLVSSQEINNTDSHLERRGDDIVSVTTKENYVNLLFKRDTNMPNYNKIKALEAQYDSLPPYPSGKLKKFLRIAGIILSVLGVLSFAVVSENGALAVVFGIVALALGVGGIVGSVFKSKKDKEETAIINSKSAEIRKQARALLA
ncbi:MAG: DUF308 domain-containing protein [Clostridia bacterium]|nr:DUF308 domain-containing protein [Clostridia bacterium]